MRFPPCPAEKKIRLFSFGVFLANYVVYYFLVLWCLFFCFGFCLFVLVFVLLIVCLFVCLFVYLSGESKRPALRLDWGWFRISCLPRKKY